MITSHYLIFCDIIHAIVLVTYFVNWHRIFNYFLITSLKYIEKKLSTWLIA